MPELTYPIYNEHCGKLLAPYASLPENSRGRHHPEPEGIGRSCYQRDRDRIIHATAFRRLEYKTQVFLNNEGDHYRTRLTHSLEVAQLTRDTCRELHLDEDLGEAVALAHDMGHTPFGHAGEEGLHEKMQPYGGFDHNAQAIHILTTLERKYAAFDGLNLTWECLEGIAKHNGPVQSPPRALATYNQQYDLALHTYPGLEAQIASLCDDIAYNNHDIEDGLRAELFIVRDLEDLPLIGPIIIGLEEQYPGLEQGRLIHELRRRSIHSMIRDLVTTTQANLHHHSITTVEDIRHAPHMIAVFSEEMRAACATIKQFLFEHMYHHPRLLAMRNEAISVIAYLFDYYLQHPLELPSGWREQAGLSEGTQHTAIIIADFIAGMTDRFAFADHRRINGTLQAKDE